jgi:hypothetical protein
MRERVRNADTLLSPRASYFYLDRTAVTDSDRDRLTVQHLPERI